MFPSIGFSKVTARNIPRVSMPTISMFARIAGGGGANMPISQSSLRNLRVDFVQVRRLDTAHLSEVRCLVFPAMGTSSRRRSQVYVSVTVHRRKQEVVATLCDQCIEAVSCTHIMTLIVWLHNNTGKSSVAFEKYWGSDSEMPSTSVHDPRLVSLRRPPARASNRIGLSTSAQNQRRHVAKSGRPAMASDVLGTITSAQSQSHQVTSSKLQSRTSDMMGPSTSTHSQSGLVGNVVVSTTEPNDNKFLNSVLFRIDGLGRRDCGPYENCCPVLEQFKTLFLHQMLLNPSKYNVRDTRTFEVEMKVHVGRGVFDQLAMVTPTCYKTPLWLEIQYMRLRCSLIYRIGWCKTAEENEKILEALDCRERENRVLERRQLKQRKCAILKLVAKKFSIRPYEECGLLLSKIYPYICAAPDGIGEDHIIEIKVPKTIDDLHRYLVAEQITPHYMTQIQIQMYVANVKKALYCVLSPNFEQDGELSYVWIQADMILIANLLFAAKGFWNDVVFPHLSRIYLDGPNSATSSLTDAH